MAKYRKKPVVIEARLLTLETMSEIKEWIGDKCEETYTHEQDFLRKTNPTGLSIPTLEGRHNAKIGDFVIQGVQNEFYSCKPDIFELTYELVEE